MNAKDLRIDTYTNSSSKVDMRITYVPNGIYVEGSSVKGKYRLQGELIKELEIKLKESERPGPHISPEKKICKLENECNHAKRYITMIYKESTNPLVKRIAIEYIAEFMNDSQIAREIGIKRRT